jgi:hypothetical protein
MLTPEQNDAIFGPSIRVFRFIRRRRHHKDRQWTVRNVIERLAAIRRDKIAMGSVEFEKVTTPEPDQQTVLDYLKVRL